jgi:hypothetical protein
MQKGILIEDSLVEMINGKRLKEMEPYPKEIVQTLFPESKKRGLFHGQYLQPILQTGFSGLERNKGKKCLGEKWKV